MGQFVVAFDVGPIAFDEIFEKKGTGKPCVILEVGGGSDLE